jgi:Zn-dependent protease
VSDKKSKSSLGQTVAAFVLTCAVFALALLGILHLGFYPDWRLFAVAFLISSVIGTVIHEGGHIVVALGFGRPIGEVRLGSGPVLVHFHFRGAIVRVGTWPFGGGKVWLRAGAKLGNWEGVAFAASGIAVNTVAAAFAFGFSYWSPTVLTAFFCANAFMAVANLIPIESEDGGPNDGTQILARLGILDPKSNAELARAISQKATVLKLEDLALELWTASADEALSVALRIAEASGAAQLGTEHLLAGVLADQESPGARTLADMGFSGERLLPLLVKGTAATPPSWSNEALTAVMFAIDAADPALGAGTGELCQGVLAATKGRGSAVLKEADITLAGFREELEPLRQPEIIVGCTKAMHFAWAIRATARLRAKRYADARADYLAMTPLAPGPHERAVALNNAAWAALMVGDPAWRADALERVQQALAIEPDPPFIRGTLAYALVENGKPVEGLAALDSFDDTKTSPGGQASNLCVRAIAEARLGQSEAAARHLRDAQALDPACELLDRARAEQATALAADRNH